MSNCKIRQFSSLTKNVAREIGQFHASARVGNKGQNVVLQLHGKDEDPESADTGLFLCFFPREAAKLAMKLLDACHKQGFDVDSFQDKWVAKAEEKDEVSSVQA